jgi:NitT/TauT family transport system permease protein
MMPTRVIMLFAPLFTLVLVLALWLYAATLGGVSVTLLPHPADAFNTLWGGLAGGKMLPHLWATLRSALLGLALGTLAGVSLAAVMAIIRSAERSFMIYLVAFQSIPKAALAPLIFLWFGFGMMSTVLLAALSCLYPIFANAFAGFRSADQNLHNLYRVCGASRWDIFWAVQVPAALGPIMVGLEVSVIFALLATVVMEFVAGTVGLGTLIQSAASTYDTPTVFAAIALLAAIGVSSSALVRFIRRRIIFWENAGSAGGVEGGL